MIQTVSEREFEAFCRLRGIPLARIPAADTRTPDYEVTLGSERIVIEVKETSPNPEEFRSLRLLEQRGVGTVTGGTPGDRVRKMIWSASAQLKARSRGQLPALLVIFDQGRVAGHVEGYHIRVAMYGLEQVHIAVPAVGQERPIATGASQGPKRKMTETTNTSISAVGALMMSGPESHQLCVYRNRFARVPLDPELFRPFGVKHFDIGTSDEGRASEWIELASGREPLHRLADGGE